MEYEVGSVADLIAGLHTPRRSRIHPKAVTPTKHQPPTPNTPGDTPRRPLRPAPKLTFSSPAAGSAPSKPATLIADTFDSPKSAPLKKKSKFTSSFQFLSQVSDDEAEFDTANKRSELLKKGKDPETIVKEYFEDKNGIVDILKKSKSKKKCSESDDSEKIKSKGKKKSKQDKNKQDEDKNGEADDVPVFPFKEDMANEIQKKLKALRYKHSPLEDDKQILDEVVEKKIKKKKQKQPLPIPDEIETSEPIIKKKRKHEKVKEPESTDDLLVDKPLKKRLKKSKKAKVDQPNQPKADAIEAEAPEASDPEVSDPEENGEEKLTDFQKSAQRRIEAKLAKEKKVVHDDVERTLFIGNIPISILKMNHHKKMLKNKFAKYGGIESIRIRNIPVEDLKTKPKVALIENKFHKERSTVSAYIKFRNASSVVKALVENNTLIEGNHIRVDSCKGTKPNTDNRKTLFLGNLPFNIEEETVRNLFENCGGIESVRVVRDKVTQIGKGFGFVNFKKADGVQLALSMSEEDLKINGKVIRIKRYNTNPSREDNFKTNDRRSNINNVVTRKPESFIQKGIGKKRDEQGNKIRKRNLINGNEENINKPKANKNRDVGENNFSKTNAKESDDSGVKKEKKVNKHDNKSFIGVMATKKKKHKLNKGILKKKKISKILLK